MEDYNEKERIIDMESPKLKTLNITSPSERVVEELRSPSELEKMEFRGDEVVYEDGVTADSLKMTNSNPDVVRNRFSTIDHAAFEAWEMSQPSPYDKKNNDAETVQINSEDSALIESIINQNRNRGKGIFAKIKNNLAGRGF